MAAGNSVLPKVVHIAILPAMRTCAFLALGFLTLAPAAHAAGFDCAKASTAIEKAICAGREAPSSSGKQQPNLRRL